MRSGDAATMRETDRGVVAPEALSAPPADVHPETDTGIDPEADARVPGLRYLRSVSWFERLVERVRAFDPRVVDGAVAVVAALLGVVSVLQQEVKDGYREPGAVAIVLAVVISLPITFRRTYPWTALSVSAAAILTLIGLDYPEGTSPTSVLLLTYSVAAWSPPVRAWIGVAEVWAVIVVLGALDSPGLDTAGVLGNLAIFTVAWVIGYAIRTRRESEQAKLREAEERAELERQRSARILAEERLRIAQELHDVVAHSMSVIAVQAGVGSHVLDSQPEQARAALDAISTTSRGTLAEMRRLLGVLRGDDGGRAHAPAPGLADVPSLVEELRAVGLPVVLTVSGCGTTTPPGVELSAYRVVQEALTNVLKHAGPVDEVEVRVEHRPGRLAVEVVDDGRGLAAVPVPPADGAMNGGHGLLGMRERVELWGGELSVGPRVGGGFRVRAVLPYEEATT
jgi:signal transduction histidine kinase